MVLYNEENWKGYINVEYIDIDGNRAIYHLKTDFVPWYIEDRKELENFAIKKLEKKKGKDVKIIGITVNE